MEHHEEPVGDDLWQNIESRLVEPTNRRPMPAWRRYGAAAAVALAVIGTGALLWHGSDDSTVNQPAVTMAPDMSNTAPEGIVGDGLVEPDASLLPTRSLAADAVHQKKNRTTPDAGTLMDQATTVHEKPRQATIAAPQNNSEEVGPINEAPRQPLTINDEKRSASHLPSPAVTQPITIRPVDKRSPVTVDFYASSSTNNIKQGKKYYRGMMDDDKRMFASLPVSFRLFKSADETDSIDDPEIKRRGKHHAPYSFGLSVRVPLIHRLALNSGVVYTQLKSSFTSGEQTLQYLGVPLGVTYHLWGYKRFNVYAIGGVQADFNVKASLKRVEQINAINIKKDRVQFSGLIGPGLQLDLMQGLGVYLEPTGRYYFNNGSDVDNYFKEKPWNINFNAGLRFTLQ